MPCSHGNRTPQEQYDMMMTFSHYPNNVYMWFGRTAEEILKALDFWDKAKTDHGHGYYCAEHDKTWHNLDYCYLCRQSEQTKYSFSGRPFDPNTGTYLTPEEEMEQKSMTRQEALNKIKWCDGDDRILNILEVLGLLKFDEVKKEEPETVRLPVDDRTYEIGSDTYGVKIESIIKVLKKAGYRIYKGGYGREL